MATPQDRADQTRVASDPSANTPDNTVSLSETTHVHASQGAESLNTRVPISAKEAHPARSKDAAARNDVPAVMLTPRILNLDSAATRPQLGEVTQPISADQLAAATIPAQPPPRQVGSYEILQEIARGGMGVVYKAHQRGLNRVVALKMTLTGDFAGDQERERFRVEAEAAGQLDHPSIVPIYEVSEHEGRPFFSMGFVDGPSLRELLNSGPIAPRRAAEIMLKVAQAVDYAHSRGVVHRDLKPANIMLDSSGLPRITDFGLAKQVSTHSELTTTGQILGTPSFMPPEQAQGKIDQVGPLADVYSLGATLYCLLTGRPPFQAASLMDTLMQVAHQEPVSPRTLDPTIPRDVETICLKCLEKTPARRYGSAQELALDLKRFLDGEPVQARPLGRVGRAWRWCRRKPLAASLIATVSMLFLFTSVGYWYRLQYAATAKQLALTESLKRLSDFHAGMSRARELNARLQTGSTWLVEKQLAEIAQLVPGPEDQSEYDALLSDVQSRYDLRQISSNSISLSAGCMAFSPDGTRLAIGQRKHSTGFAVNVYDTAQIPLSSGVRPTAAPFPAAIASYTVSTVGTAFTQFISGNSRFQDGARALAWSPDGKWLVVGSRFGKITRWDTTQADDPGSTWSVGERPLTRLWFSADGSVLYSMNDQLRQWNVKSNWQEITEKQPNITSVATSPDGRFTVQLDKQDRLVVLESQTAAPYQVFPSTEDEFEIDSDSLAFIGDGRLIAGKDKLRRLHIWDIATCREIVQPISSADDACQWAFNSAKNWLALTDVESKIMLQIYELRKPQSIQSFLLPGQPRAIDFSSDSQELAVVSTSHALEERQPWTELSRWSLSDSQPLKQVRAVSRTLGKLQPLPTISWNPKAAQVAWFAGVEGLLVSELSNQSVQRNESLPADQPVSHRLVLRSERANHTPLPLASQPEASEATKSDNRDILQLKELSIVADEGSLPVQWSADGKTLWGFINSNKRLVAWDSTSLQPVASWSNKFSDISTGQGTVSCFGVHERYIVCGGEDGYLTVLPAQRPAATASDSQPLILPLSHSYGPGGPIKAIAMGLDEVAAPTLQAESAGKPNTESTSNTTANSNAPTGPDANNIPNNENTDTARDDLWMAVASQTGSVQIRTLPSGKVISDIPSDHGSTETIAFNGVRKILATGGEDGAIRIYGLDKQLQSKPLITLSARIGVITQLKLSPDGRYLAAIGTRSKSVTVWDLSKLSGSL